MADVNNDEELLSLVRVTVGASNLSELPTSDLRKELAQAKQEVNSEVKEMLNRGGTLDFYNQDAPQKALTALMFIRGKQIKDRKRGRKRKTSSPRGISAIKRHEFTDANERFWRDEMVRNLNRIREE